MAREPAEIEREIELTRVYLTDTVDAIAHKVSPKVVADQAKDKVKATVAKALSGGTETFTTKDASGEGTTYEVKRKLRLDRVGMAAGGLAGLVGLAVAVRRLRRR